MTRQQIIKEANELVLSDFAIDWIKAYYRPIVALDFHGWVININKKVKALVSPDGQYVFFKVGTKNPHLSAFENWRTKRKLKKMGFLRRRGIEVFPEDCPNNRIPFDSENAVFIAEFFFYPLSL